MSISSFFRAASAQARLHQREFVGLYFVLHALFIQKKRNGYIVIASIRPLCYLLQNHWTKSNQILCVSYSHKWGVQQPMFGAPPLGPWEGVKRSNSIKFQFKSQFQIFLYQTLSVYSQIKDVKHIGRDFDSVAWVLCAPGVGLGRARGQKMFYFLSWSCGLSNWEGGEQNRIQVTF